jgi:hypothetical protein
MEIIPKVSTLNELCYKDNLSSLCNSVHLNSPELWRMKERLLLFDNALAHHSVPVPVGVGKSRGRFCRTVNTDLISQHVISLFSSY